MEKDAYNILEFCQRHGISRALYYKLDKIGQAPRIMRVNGRIMISKEASADWRREREAEPAKQTVAA